MSLSGKYANFTLASLVSLHYKMCKDGVKSGTFKLVTSNSENVQN